MNKEFRIWITYLLKDSKKIYVDVYVIESDNVKNAYAIAINKFINRIIGEQIIINSVEVDDVTKRDSVYN